MSNNQCCCWRIYHLLSLGPITSLFLNMWALGPSFHLLFRLYWYDTINLTGKEEKDGRIFFFHLFFFCFHLAAFPLSFGIQHFLCSFNINTQHSRGQLLKSAWNFAIATAQICFRVSLLVDYDRLSHCLLHRYYLQLHIFLLSLSPVFCKFLKISIFQFTKSLHCRI